MDVKEEEEDMMTLRRMMLRRQTDPKTGKHTLSSLRKQNAHGPSRRTILWKFTRKMPDANPGHGSLREPAQAKRTWTFHKSNLL